MADFTTSSFPEAVRQLFALNNYAVEMDIHLNGAQIDLIARSIASPFEPPIYIEATISYVDNNKYALDSTKFLLIREKDPSAICLIVSAAGFTPEVRERANASRVQTLTYDDLFRQFEKFAPFVDHILTDQELIEFENTYEEPYFRDPKGEDLATEWLTSWRNDPSAEGKWLILLGEYGTGKTSLTRILQYRWLLEHRASPALPIPFRIELRAFTRQFDARTLLHHFLDSNNLGHIPIDFVYHLMRTGRIILLLDGYDEMAQFLNARERRACLGALAQLATDGAKGILTSRPNYFTETEELRVFEALYATLDQNKYYIGKSDKDAIAQEKAVDSLVTKYLLDRYERYIRDLSQEQTESLVRRKLRGDAAGQEVVLDLLRRVFREEVGGERQALSGKPVIIAYLLELIDEFRETKSEEVADITEWQIYKMIVDRLMLRDQQRSPLDPQRRRRCLHYLALALSRRDTAVASEATFEEVIGLEFKSDLRLMDAEERRHKRDELFEDLRGSATLTRAEGGGGGGWVFSHNSLREYLCVEHFLEALLRKHPAEISLPITGAMKNFAAALPQAFFDPITTNLQEAWHQRASKPALGRYLGLLWDRLGPAGAAKAQNLRVMLGIGPRSTIPLDTIKLSDIPIYELGGSGEALNLSMAGSELTELIFDHANLTGSNFVSATIDTCSFRSANLTRVDFRGSLIFESDFSDAEIKEADFRNLDKSSSIFVKTSDGVSHLTGAAAIGYLAFHGAETDAVEDYYIWQHHPRFAIVTKIASKILDQRNNQWLGLTQRGEAHADPPFARALVRLFESQGWVEVDRHELVSLTDIGRRVMGEFMGAQRMPAALREFLERERR